jgi:hypothetical protein
MTNTDRLNKMVERASKAISGEQMVIKVAGRLGLRCDSFLQAAQALARENVSFEEVCEICS